MIFRWRGTWTGATLKPWTEWEDYAAGLYQRHYTARDVERSRALLEDPNRFAAEAADVLVRWPNASIHNLRYLWTGRNAWLGQAACCYAHRAPAVATREAWGMMTHDSQKIANRVAKDIRSQWEKGAQHGGQTLFAV